MPFKIFQFECNEAHVKKHISGGRFGENFFTQNSELHSSFGHWVCGMGGGNEICVWSLLLSISINNIWVFIFRFLLWCLSIWVFLFGASFLGLCFQGLFFYLKIGVYSLRPGGVSFGTLCQLVFDCILYHYWKDWNWNLIFPVRNHNKMVISKEN